MTKTNELLLMKQYVFTMAAAFIGVVLGIVGSMGIMTAYIDDQLAAQGVKNYNLFTSQAAPATPVLTVCEQDKQALAQSSEQEATQILNITNQR